MPAGFNLHSYTSIPIAKSILPSAPSGSYNYRPGQVIPVITRWEEGPVITIEGRMWGLKPTWKKDADLLTQARFETAGEKPTFKTAFENSRVAIPMVGYFHHCKDPKSPATYEHGLGAGLVLYAGGLSIKSGGIQYVVILTTAIATLDSLFKETFLIKDSSEHRTPAFLDPELLQQWLDPEIALPHEFFPVLAPPETMNSLKVTCKANEGRNDASVLEPPSTYELSHRSETYTRKLARIRDTVHPVSSEEPDDCPF